MARGYGEPVGDEYGARGHDRWRGDDRDRPDWRQRERGWSERDRDWRGRDEDRGFFERAGDEIRSWFRDEDDDLRGRGSWDPDRDYGRRGRDRGDFGGMAQGGMGRTGGDWDRGWGGQRTERSGHAQSWGEANRGGSGGSVGYEEFGGTLGGFGNQRFGSSLDDHYRSWRDKQIEQLDRDYQEYCRECEQKFHQDFESWRRSRTGSRQQDQGQGLSQGSDELILGTGQASSTGAPSTGQSESTAEMTGSTGSTEMAGAGSTSDSSRGTGSGSGRSGSRSRS